MFMLIYLIQHGYELPRDCKDMVYFNVAFTGDDTIYSYPSCCVFLRPPLFQSTSVTIVREFWNDLVAILESYPLNVRPQSAVNESQPKVNRVPWHEKLRRDFQYDIELKRFLKSAGCWIIHEKWYFTICKSFFYTK